MRVLTTRTCGRLGNVFVEHVCLRVEPVTEEEPCEDLDFDWDLGAIDEVCAQAEPKARELVQVVQKHELIILCTTHQKKSPSKKKWDQTASTTVAAA